MSFLTFCAVGVVSLFLLYVGARLVSAAYFKSKQDHEATRKVTR